MQLEVLYLSPTYPGSNHDKKICNEEKFKFDKKVHVLADLGFEGLSSDTAQIVLPIKRKKNKVLTQEDKDYNRWMSKYRVKVEHIIGGVKIFRIVKEQYRGRMNNREDDIMLIACALHNLRIKIKNNTL